MKGWERIKIAPHAVERYIQRVAPGMTWGEAEEVMRVQLKDARKAGTALGGGDVWCLSPLAYVVIARDRSNRGLVLKTVLLPDQVREGQQLLALQEAAEDAGVPVPEVNVEVPPEANVVVSPDPGSNVRGINSDPDMIRMLEDVLSLAREGKLTGFACVYQLRDDRDMWFRYTLLKGCSVAAMVGELELAKHVMVSNYAERSCR